MHAEHAQLLAAVGFAAPTGDADAAVAVRLDGAAIAGRQVAGGIVDRLHFDAQFVVEDAGITEEGLPAMVGVVRAKRPGFSRTIAFTGAFLVECGIG